MKQDLLEIIQNLIEKQKISHAFLVNVDETYETKHIIDAIKLIIRSEVEDDNKYNEIVNQIDNEVNPDLIIIRPEGKAIKKEQIANLIMEFNNRSVDDLTRFYVVEYAENLNQFSANSILKFIEEPEQKIIAFLITKNINNVIPTIVSRCQIIDDNRYVEREFSEEQRKAYSNYFNILLDEQDKSTLKFQNIYSLKPDQISEMFSYFLYACNDILNYVYKNNKKRKVLTEKECEKYIKNISISYIIELCNRINSAILYLNNNINTRMVLDYVLIGGEVL